MVEPSSPGVSIKLNSKALAFMNKNKSMITPKKRESNSISPDSKGFRRMGTMVKKSSSKSQKKNQWYDTAMQLKKKRPKPKINKETLNAVVMHVMKEADEDGNGNLDINECRSFLKKLLAETYPGKEWDEESYKRGFYAIDMDKGGDISIDELFAVIYKNAVRQGMMTDEP